jgi:hypothetical protein
MKKRKRVRKADIFCRPVWETEITDRAEHWGTTENDTRAGVIIRWMEEGDLRPLAVHLGSGSIHPAVADQLIQMINHQQLKVVTGKKGRPKKPELFARTIETGLDYERRNVAGASAATFEKISAERGVGESTARADVRNWRKSRAKKVPT